ncbi:MAG TPA: hypothetical protein VFG04_02825 [Planctomycetaceae bacterium]|nr:hypothetical protein [Planctomycetaceae bacterium]
MLPEIRKQTNFAFRQVPVDAREELIQEVVAQAYALFVRLCQRGKTGLVYSTPLAQFAIRKVRAGRRIGSRANIRDITSPRPAVTRAFRIERLDRFNQRTGQWRDVLVEDRTAGPAEIAAARIDCAAWLGSLSPRHRKIASVLAAGETTGVAARKFRLSSARISQIRVWFRESWQRFHGDSPSVSLARC